MSRLHLAIACSALFALTSAAHAQTVIRSPTAVVSNTAGAVDLIATIESTIDQSGLSSTFTSGVTDFSAYLATNPTHSYIYTDGAEWFSTAGTTSATVVYDLGASYDIRQLSLWNEEFSGIQTMAVSTSNDPGFGVSSGVGNFNPINTPFDADYPAEIFTLSPTTARYVRLELTGPQTPNRGTYVSMGEIAFGTLNSNANVPEPGSIALLIGLGATGVLALRRRK